MNLERIGKRINENLQKYEGVTRPYAMPTIRDIFAERQKALQIYKELIVRIHDIVEDGAPRRTGRIIVCIEELEEKYYPQPKDTHLEEKIKSIVDKCLFTKEFCKELAKQVLKEIEDESA